MNKFMISFVAALLFTSCVSTNKKEISIEFLENNRIEVNEKLNPCNFINKLNGSLWKKVGEERTVKLNGLIVECPIELDTSKIGNQTLIYRVENKQFKYEIEVVDTISPVIDANSKYEVEVGNSYFNILKVAEIKDNYSSVLSLGLNGSYDLNKAGIYNIEIVAIDESKNKSTKKVEVEVKEKEVKKEVVEVVTTVPPTNREERAHESTESNVLSNKKVESNTKGIYKQFLFSEGYTMRNVTDACVNYLNQFNSGSCYPLKDENGKTIGMEYYP